jgi:hypothetical protein
VPGFELNASFTYVMSCGISMTILTV